MLSAPSHRKLTELALKDPRVREVINDKLADQLIRFSTEPDEKEKQDYADVFRKACLRNGEAVDMELYRKADELRERAEKCKRVMELLKEYNLRKAIDSRFSSVALYLLREPSATTIDFLSLLLTILTR